MPITNYQLPITNQITNYFVVKRYPHGSQKKPLIIIVSKKTAAKAVQRNKIRRRIRAIMAPIQKTNHNDYVIIAKTGILNMNFNDLKKEIIMIIKGM